jgi:hypothetical protein
LTASADLPAASQSRRSAADRAARRVRILARLQEGWSYDKIALTEDLTRERVRQIVVDAMEQREVDPSREHAILQSARLDGALRLAAEKVAEGELNAIYALLQVLERLDKYQRAAGAREVDKTKDDISFKTKLADLVQRARAARAQQEAAAGRDRRDGAGAGGEELPNIFAFSPAER